MSTNNALPPVPLTVDGAAVMHQMLKIDWASWRLIDPEERDRLVEQATFTLNELERGDTNTSAMFTILGHKSDLMLVHFRERLEQLTDVELRLARLPLFEFLIQESSYISVVELGLYESTQKVYASLQERGVVPHSPEWDAEIESVLGRQREAMHPRLFPSMPEHKFICFYPMDRRRGETKNWYLVPFAERARMMHEHGMIGRRYAGEVKQIISGSIGFDDWEWGVDLFADDPLVFKRLIYEMRFDEVSAEYALFGSFYIGSRYPPSRLAHLLRVE